MNTNQEPKDHNLFTDLKKYRPRQGMDPRENFVTASFCWILRNNQAFSSFLLDKISKELNVKMDIHGGAWITQATFGDVFPDMIYVYEDNKVLIFEHKIWSDLHHNQLTNYKKFADGKYAAYHVVLITANVRQHAQDPDKAYCWNDIYGWITSFIESKGENFLLRSFQQLLAHEGVGPQPPISYEVIKTYFVTKDFVSNLETFVKNMNNRRVLQDIIGDSFVFEQKWGTLGVRYNVPWKPSMFVGFMLDGNQYYVPHILEKDGCPSFVFILSFDESLHSIYSNSQNYQNLINELTEKIPALAGDWEFYNHLEDQEAKGHNKWHPLYIRKSMLELFRGATSAEQQNRIVDKAINTILPILWGSEHTKKMIAEFNTNKV